MPSTDASDNQGVCYYEIPAFKFASGAVLPIKIAYKSINPSAKKAVLIPTCFGGRVNSTLNFTSPSGSALSSYHVIIAAMLGNGESTSPSNNPSFPAGFTLRYEDCVNAQYELVTRHLGLTQLEAVLGFSMGGQQAYYWAVMHGSGSSGETETKTEPQQPFVKNAIVICGSARTSGHNYAFLEGPISALEASWDYDGGRYRERKGGDRHPTQGLRAFGRAYAGWLTSAEWFRRGLWREFGASSLRAWLHPAEGQAPFESWDAQDLLVLARMWQAGDVGAVGGAGDYRQALRGVAARVLVMPCETDQYFDWRDGEDEVRYLKNGTFAPIPSIWGHIAGGGANGVDVRWMDAKIAEFLQTEA